MIQSAEMNVCDMIDPEVLPNNFCEMTVCEATDQPEESGGSAVTKVHRVSCRRRSFRRRSLRREPFRTRDMSQTGHSRRVIQKTGHFADAHFTDWSFRRRSFRRLYFDNDSGGELRRPGPPPNSAVRTQWATRAIAWRKHDEITALSIFG